MSGAVLITGANRGIGLAFVNHYLAQGETVIATCRQPQQATELQRLKAQFSQQLSLLPLDICDPASRQALADSLSQQPLALLINNAGIYGPKNVDFTQLSANDGENVLLTNALAPLLVTQALLPQLMLSSAAKVVFISSKMGSITDNGKGGSYLYRASKAALNAAVRSLAIDYQQLIVGLLHPGWVQTDMGGKNALITAAQSVVGMSQLIAALDQTQSGNFYAFDGKQIPW